MSNKRQKKLRERAARFRELRQRGYQVQQMSKAQMSLLREVDYIIARAAQHDSRCVTYGPFSLFSTQSGDAWMLDPEDQFALCLARDGVRQPVHIEETDGNMVVEWDRDYSMDEASFTSVERATGRVTTVHGYPTKAILESIQHARELQE